MGRARDTGKVTGVAKDMAKAIGVAKDTGKTIGAARAMARAMGKAIGVARAFGKIQHSMEIATIVALWVILRRVAQNWEKASKVTATHVE